MNLTPNAGGAALVTLMLFASDAEEGLCATECDVLPAFLVLFLLINISTFIPATAGQAATIRCVPDKQRSFAFGIQSTAIRFLGKRGGLNDNPSCMSNGGLFQS